VEYGFGPGSSPPESLPRPGRCSSPARLGSCRPQAQPAAIIREERSRIFREIDFGQLWVLSVWVWDDGMRASRPLIECGEVPAVLQAYWWQYIMSHLFRVVAPRPSQCSVTNSSLGDQRTVGPDSGVLEYSNLRAWFLIDFG